MGVPTLKLQDISIDFGNKNILKNINIDIFPGEIHIITGENGAGKSTLMKIISGVYTPDEGSLYWQGEKVEISSPNQANNMGIVSIYQEPNLFPGLSIAENLYLHKWKNGIKLINWQNLCKKSKKLLRRFGIDHSPKTPVGNLGLAEKQMIEIIRAFNQDCKLIILDEATAALNQPELDLLKEVIKEVSSMGVAIFFVSQRPEDLKKIGDRVTIVKGGELIETKFLNSISSGEILQKMIRKTFSERYPKLSVEIGNEVLRVENLIGPHLLNNVNLEINKSEIVGLYGIMGSGRTQLGKALFGLLPIKEGQIFINGNYIETYNHEQAIDHGICYISENSRTEGLVLNRSVKENITITDLDRFIEHGLIDINQEDEISKEYINKLAIKGVQPHVKVETLSGGQRQKLILAKWFNYGANIFILDEPTRGIDIPSKTDVYNILNKLVLSGSSIFLISSDIDELLGMCDRILIMSEGTIIEEISHDEADADTIFKMAYK